MLKVLIAEDDLLIADWTEAVLVGEGYEVCGIARTVAEGVALGRRHKPDLAVLDLRLADGGLGTEIAAQLGAIGRLGVLYATGNSAHVELTVAQGDGCLIKPFTSADLLRSLKIVAEIVATGTSPPFPRGFRVLPSATTAPIGSPRIDDDATKIRNLFFQQAAVAAFGSFALRQTDLSSLLTEAARVCAECLGVPFSKVCRFREAENDFIVEAGYGWQEGVVGRVVSRADASSPHGRAFVTGEPAVCNDVRQDDDFELAPFYAAHGIISTIDVLIKGDKLPYGVLEIDNNERHDYDQHDINFLTGFANVLAEAVATATRTAVLQATIEQMKVMVEEKDRLPDRTKVLAEMQSHLLDQKMALAEELQHRVRNNLQVVHVMLSRQIADTADEVGRRGITAILRRISAMAQVYSHLVGTEMTRTTDFGSYAKSLCLDLVEIQSAAGGAVTLTCDSDPLILDLAVVTALGIVIAELVTNSYDHAFAGGKGAINVSVRRAAGDADMASLTISDNGSGLKGNGEGKRHGLGLVRRQVEQIGGTLTLDSDHGTDWTIKFPTLIAATSATG